MYIPQDNEVLVTRHLHIDEGQFPATELKDLKQTPKEVDVTDRDNVIEVLMDSDVPKASTRCDVEEGNNNILKLHASNMDSESTSGIQTTRVHEEIETDYAISNNDGETNNQELEEEFEETTHGYNLRSRQPVQYGLICTSEDLIKEPQSFDEAMRSPQREEWEKAIDNEMNAHLENGTWEITELPNGRKALGSKVVFRIKRNPDGTVERYKARLVVQGCQQKAGIDYCDTYAPVVDFTTVRLLLAIAAQKRMHIHQMDVSTAFLNGTLQEEIYMRLPEGLKERYGPGKIGRLIKSLYGLKQAPRVWFKRLREDLLMLNFETIETSESLFIIRSKWNTLFLLVYVDDVILISTNMAMIVQIKTRLKSLYKMTDKGEAKYFLGVEIRIFREKGTIFLSQEGYSNQLLRRFGMECSRPVLTPSVRRSQESLDSSKRVTVRQHAIYRTMVGSLLYLSTKTRPDISEAVGVVARHVEDPTLEDWTAVKRIFKYLRGTSKLGLIYPEDDASTMLHGYCDADWAGDKEERKSTGGFVLKIGKCLVSWRSQKQAVVAPSTSEAEYIALFEISKEITWLRRLLKELGFEQKNPTIVREDNQSCISWTRDNHNDKTKQIDIKYHYTRNLSNKALPMCNIALPKRCRQTY